jgi:hypothetical protein
MMDGLGDAIELSGDGLASHEQQPDFIRLMCNAVTIPPKAVITETIIAAKDAGSDIYNL